MSEVYPLRPKLTVNRQFMHEFISAETPCFALGVVEERKRQCGFLALRPHEVIPPTITNAGFRFGHSLFGNTSFAVVHFAFEFYGFKTYNVLVRIPVIPATQSSAKLPCNPEEACHRIQTKAATPSERSDAWIDQVTLRSRRFSRWRAVCASTLLSEQFCTRYGAAGQGSHQPGLDPQEPHASAPPGTDW